MNPEPNRPTLLVVRPHPKMGGGHSDLLRLESGGGEQLVHREKFLEATPWLAAMTPWIFEENNNGIPGVIVDLAEVRWLNSTSLGDIVNLYHEIDTRDGTVVLANVSPRIVGILEITQLNRLFKAFDSLEDAAGFFEVAEEPG